MKKTKMEKGITLVALIITIVILLILAAVAISSITNDGILRYATNAAKDYNQAVANEQGILGYYENYLKNMTVGETVSTITFTINSEEYTAKEGMTWRQWIDSPDYDSYSEEYGNFYSDGNVCIMTDDGHYVGDGAGGWPTPEDPIIAGFSYDLR